MFVYSGTNCPYCEQPLTETDDLAVCPECGTPHHRACYMEHGACANTAKHADGFEWTAPDPAAAQPEQIAAETPAADKTHADNAANAAQSAQRRCPNCGTVAGPQDHFCLHCGTVLPRISQMPNFSTPGSRSAAGYQQPNAAQTSFTARINMDERVDGIPVRDWLIYFGNSAFPFLHSFRKQDVTGRKTGFNFGASIIPTLYFFYYKVWHIGALCAVALGIFNTPSLLLTFFSGSRYILGLPAATWETISTIAGALGLVFSIAVGFYANYLIRVDAGKKIRAMRRSCSNEQQYMELLNRKKCPSKLVIGLIIGYIAVLFIGMFF